MGSKRTTHRLSAWDYARPGMYYVTICTSERKHVLGRIVFDEGNLEEPAAFLPSNIGTACIEAENSLNERFNGIHLEKLTIMPDHVHMLVRIDSDGPTDLGDVVFAFKRFVTRKAKAAGFSNALWQKNYYDHVVRDDEDVLRIMEYMDNNPIRWAQRQQGSGA